MKTIYLIGSLRNEAIPEIANTIEERTGYEVFADWFAPGPRADDHWKEYEQARGRNYKQAIEDSYAAQHVFEFDSHHINRTDIGVLAMPAGKSGHLELGVMIGKGKPGFILFEDGADDRWDVMTQYATLCFSMDELVHELERLK